MGQGIDSASSKDIINNIESLLKELDNLYSAEKYKEPIVKYKSFKEIDWNIVEQRFQKVYFDRLRQNNQMNYWEISQWFKEELGL